MEISLAGQISIALAKVEASALGQEIITSDLAMAGITKLEDFEEDETIKHLSHSFSGDERIYQIERQILIDLFGHFDINMRSFRRKLRVRIGQASGQQGRDGEIPISDSLTQALRRAEELAQQSHSPFVSVNLLLAVILEIEETATRSLLLEMGIQWREVFEAATKANIANAIEAAHKRDRQKEVREVLQHIRSLRDSMRDIWSLRDTYRLHETRVMLYTLSEKLADLPEELSQVEAQISEVELITRLIEDYQHAEHMVAERDFSKAQFTLMSISSRGWTILPQGILREVKDATAVLGNVFSLQREIEDYLMTANFREAAEALHYLESEFLPRSGFARDSLYSFSSSLRSALYLIDRFEQSKRNKRWDEAISLLPDASTSDFTPRIREWIQTELNQLQNQVGGWRDQRELQELESKADSLRREIEAISIPYDDSAIGYLSREREIKIRELYEQLHRTQAQIESVKLNLGSVQPDQMLAPEQPKPTIRDKVQFTLFSPSKIRKTHRYSLVVYAHRPEMLARIQADAKKFVPEMGEHPPKQRTLPEPIEIGPKAEITITLECEGIEFEPKSLTKTWEGDFVRYNFDFKAPEGFKEAEAWIRISVQIKGFEIAALKTSCEIVAETAEAVPVSVALPDNPLIDAKKLAGLNQAVATPYKNIFVSYSHKDQPLALKCAKLIEQMLGSKVFIDVNGLRTGHDWQLEIAKAIDEADVLELFWSEHTAASEFCRYEWDYALKTKCPDTRCVGVIRPIYWKEPLPKPPAELEHLQFGFVDLSDLIGKENAE